MHRHQCSSIPRCSFSSIQLQEVEGSFPEPEKKKLHSLIRRRELSHQQERASPKEEKSDSRRANSLRFGKMGASGTARRLHARRSCGGRKCGGQRRIQKFMSKGIGFYQKIYRQLLKAIKLPLIFYINTINIINNILTSYDTCSKNILIIFF